MVTVCRHLFVTVSYSGVGLGIQRRLVTMALEVTQALNPSPRCLLQSNDRRFSRCM